MYGDNIQFLSDDQVQLEENVEGDDEEMHDEDGHLPVDQTDSWVVIESYFATHNLVAQQVNSFNHFIENKLQARPCTVSALEIDARTSMHCPAHTRPNSGYLQLYSRAEAPANLLTSCRSWCGRMGRL
jgi:DNA-directed RNA polymerase beta subunit